MTLQAPTIHYKIFYPSPLNSVQQANNTSLTTNLLLQNRIITRLRAGRSGARILERTRDSSLLQKVQSGSGVHLVLYLTGIELLFQEQTGRGAKLTTHLYLVPKLMSAAVFLLLLYAFMACTGNILPLPLLTAITSKSF
jgi:predicted RND superfamily exporter protein